MDANIHANNEDALISSCGYGHFEIAEWLYSLSVYNENAFVGSCSYGELEIAKWLHSLGANIHSYGELEIAKWLYSLDVDIHVNNEIAFVSSCSCGNFEIAKWLYNLDKKILINIIDQINIDYAKLGIDDETLYIINFIKNNKKLPIIEDCVDDVVVYLLFHYNMIDDIQKLNLPYVSFDIISGVIVNCTIKRLKSKSANKSY